MHRCSHFLSSAHYKFLITMMMKAYCNGYVYISAARGDNSHHDHFGRAVGNLIRAVSRGTAGAGGSCYQYNVKQQNRLATRRPPNLFTDIVKYIVHAGLHVGLRTARHSTHAVLHVNRLSHVVISAYFKVQTKRSSSLNG